jgi:hypothetical protein
MREIEVVHGAPKWQGRHVRRAKMRGTRDRTLPIEIQDELFNDRPSEMEGAQHVTEMFRRTLSDTSGAEAVIDRLSNRLAKIAAELRNLAPKWNRAQMAG